LRSAQYAENILTEMKSPEQIKADTQIQQLEKATVQQIRSISNGHATSRVEETVLWCFRLMTLERFFIGMCTGVR
jgi:hypothetical protein